MPHEHKDSHPLSGWGSAQPKTNANCHMNTRSLTYLWTWGRHEHKVSHLLWSWRRHDARSLTYCSHEGGTNTRSLTYCGHEEGTNTRSLTYYGHGGMPNLRPVFHVCDIAGEKVALVQLCVSFSICATSRVSDFSYAILSLDEWISRTRNHSRMRCGYDAHDRDLVPASQNKGWSARSRKCYCCFSAEENRRFVLTKWS